MMKKHVCKLSLATFRISFSERSLARAREWRIVQSGLLFMSYYISGVGRVVRIYETDFLICASRGRNERVESGVRVTGRCGISRAYDAATAAAAPVPTRCSPAIYATSRSPLQPGIIISALELGALCTLRCAC